MKNNFAYFISIYNDTDICDTYRLLLNLDANYPIYLVASTDDPSLHKYSSIYPKDKLLVFDRNMYVNKIDSIGYYTKYNRIVTHSRLAVLDFAKEKNIEYVAHLLSDIISIRLRYLDKTSGNIRSIYNFNIDYFMDLYVNLLNASKNIYISGPPISSYYIGCNPSMIKTYCSKFGNIVVYDINKCLEKPIASVLEDMDIIRSNNALGKLSICPFGLQINCKPPRVSADSYGNMSKLEYYQQRALIFNQLDLDVDKPYLPFKDFIPKILDEKYRKRGKSNAFVFGYSKK